MRLSVVVCTRNRAPLLADLCASLDRQQIPPEHTAELLFVDNASTDDTARVIQDRIAECRIPARYVLESTTGLSVARNRGIRETSGDYVIFLDDDALPREGWLAAFCRALETFRPAVAGGPILPYARAKAPGWLDLSLAEYDQYLGRYDKGGDTRWLPEETFIWGGNLALRRDVFAAVGDFNADLGVAGSRRTGGEDTHLERRIFAHFKTTALYVHDAAIDHLVGPEKMRFGFFVRHFYSRGLSTSRIWPRMYWRKRLNYVGREGGSFLKTLVKGNRKACAAQLSKLIWQCGMLADSVQHQLASRRKA